MTLRQRIKSALAGRPMLQRLGGGIGWSMSGNLSWRILTMVSAICVARILSASDFGAYGLILDTVATFGVLAGFRLGSTASRYVAAYRDEEPARAGRIVTLTNWMACGTSAAVVVLVILCAPLIARMQLGDSRLLWPLVVAAVAMGFRLIGQVLGFTLAGFEDFKSVAMLDVLRGVCTLVFVVPLAYVYGLTGVFAGLLMVAALVTRLSFKRIAFDLRRFSIPRCGSIRRAWSEQSVLWTFALPGVLSGLMEMGALWQSKVMLGHALGLSAVGVFIAANQWRALILFLPGIVGRVVVPVLSKEFAGDKGKFNKALQVNLRFMWMLALPMTVLLIGFSDVLAAVFGQKYAGSESVIPWLMASVFLYCVSASARHVMDSAGKRWAVTAMTFVGASVMLVGTHLALDRFGPAAPAIGMLAGYGLLLVMELVYIERVIARGQVVRRLGLYLLSLLVLALCCAARYFLTPLHAALSCAGLFVVALAPLGRLVLNLKQGKGISG